MRPAPAPVPAPRIGEALPPAPAAVMPPATSPVSPPAPDSAPAPAFALTGPVSLEVVVSAAASGEQGNAVVRMNSARDLRRVGFTLDFDASTARILSVSPGDYIGVDEVAVQYEPQPDGARGLVVRIERPAGNLPPGDAALAVIAFEALADTPPRFQLGELLVTDAAGNSVEVR